MSIAGIRPTLVLVAGLLATGSAVAADEWRHTLVLYGVGASMDGESGIGTVEADVDVGFDDILDNLEFGAMAAYRGERGRWAIVADLIYMALEQDKDGLGQFGRTRATVDADQTIFEVDGAYAIDERLSVYGGLRWWDLEVDLQVLGGGPLGTDIARSGSEDWVDPVVGARWLWTINDRWSIVTKGDIGGFGVGSDFAWHVSAFADWRFAENVSLAFGVRYLDVDYEDGGGNSKFTWDVTEGGPAVGIAWRF